MKRPGTTTTTSTTMLGITTTSTTSTTTRPPFRIRLQSLVILITVLPWPGADKSWWLGLMGQS